MGPKKSQGGHKHLPEHMEGVSAREGLGGSGVLGLDWRGFGGSCLGGLGGGRWGSRAAWGRVEKKGDESKRAKTSQNELK